MPFEGRLPKGVHVLGGNTANKTCEAIIIFVQSVLLKHLDAFGDFWDTLSNSWPNNFTAWRCLLRQFYDTKLLGQFQRGNQ